MKNKNWILKVGALLVIVGAAMKIFHLPYEEVGDVMYKVGFFGMFVYMIFQNDRLSKKVTELESE